MSSSLPTLATRGVRAAADTSRRTTAGRKTSIIAGSVGSVSCPGSISNGSGFRTAVVASSYSDVFHVMALISASGVLLALMLRKPAPTPDTGNLPATDTAAGATTTAAPAQTPAAAPPRRLAAAQEGSLGVRASRACAFWRAAAHLPAEKRSLAGVPLANTRLKCNQMTSRGNPGS
jgi:hypothetical protein